MTGYQEWAFALFPGLHFHDLLDRVEAMGKKMIVGNELMKMRETEMRSQSMPKMSWDDDEVLGYYLKSITNNIHLGSVEQPWPWRSAAHDAQAS